MRSFLTDDSDEFLSDSFQKQVAGLKQGVTRKKRHKRFMKHVENEDETSKNKLPHAVKLQNQRMLKEKRLKKRLSKRTGLARAKNSSTAPSNAASVSDISSFAQVSQPLLGNSTFPSPTLNSPSKKKSRLAKRKSSQLARRILTTGELLQTLAAYTKPQLPSHGQDQEPFSQLTHFNDINSSLDLLGSQVVPANFGPKNKSQSDLLSVQHPSSMLIKTWSKHGVPLQAAIGYQEPEQVSRSKSTLYPHLQLYSYSLWHGIQVKKQLRNSGSLSMATHVQRQRSDAESIRKQIELFHFKAPSTTQDQ
ncbi:hypothetical protein Ciccas_006650 [Cichlidogyrus casuarinus]|uniref:Uncharacterized protein n=1 Tax=Cichlidogyrus casuarinus TaxID=1844966 RepID=A0ABD2Q553_9PLAT